MTYESTTFNPYVFDFNDCILPAKSSREDGATVLKDRSIIVTKDSLMSSQSIIIDHHALAKKYKSTSTYCGIAAAVFGVACFGFYRYSLTHFVLIGPIGSSNSKSDNAAIVGTVCLGGSYWLYHCSNCISSQGRKRT